MEEKPELRTALELILQDSPTGCVLARSCEIRRVVFISNNQCFNVSIYNNPPCLILLSTEQKERIRERNEQFREFHYDGLYPRQYWFH